MADKDTLAILELLVEKISQINTSGGGLTADQLEKIVEKAAGASADTLKMALIPENKIHPGISAYSYPEGDQKRPKPKLSRKTIFCSYMQREDNLTPEEIDAFNAIDTDCEARGGSWWARIGREGLKPVLVVHCDEAVERDRARELPPIAHILLELKRGPKAVDPVALLAQLDAMRKQLLSAGVSLPQGVVVPDHDGSPVAVA